MTSAPLRIGIAGANADRGWARDAHLPALRALPGLNIHAVSARDQDIADRAAAVFGAEKAFGDTLAMVHDPDVDIVAVTVKVPEHRAIVLAALDAGKHVYCEWPLARDAEEAEQLAEATDRAGTHVAIGLQGAHSDAAREAAQLVRSGAIGDPLSLRVVSPTAGWGTTVPPHYRYLQDRRNGATLASIAGGHTLALVTSIVGPFAEFGARGSILCSNPAIAGTAETAERDCADHLLVHGRHANGCISNIEIVGGRSEPLRFELHGTAGTLAIRGDHPGGFQCAHLTVDRGEPAPPSTVPLAERNAINVSCLWRDFERDIRSRTRTVPDFRAALELHRLLETIERSAEEGCNKEIGSKP